MSFSSPYPFYKYHALGNDYIVIDPASFSAALSPTMVVALCNRHTGIGGDGILYGPIYKNNCLSLIIYNSDGSTAEKSGNGIRIFSQYLYDQNYVKDREFELQLAKDRVLVRMQNAHAKLIQVRMGQASFHSRDIPMQGPDREVIAEPIEIAGTRFITTCLSLGNPHCTIPVAELDRQKLLQFGPQIEHASLFPQRTNVQFFRVLSRNHIQAEIWERGSGYTLASGSSSCAVVSAAFRLGLVDRQVRVQMPGGSLDISVDENQMVWLTGPTTQVYKGHLAKSLIQSLK